MEKGVSNIDIIIISLWLTYFYILSVSCDYQSISIYLSIEEIITNFVWFSWLVVGGRKLQKEQLHQKFLNKLRKIVVASIASYTTYVDNWSAIKASGNQSAFFLWDHLCNNRFLYIKSYFVLNNFCTLSSSIAKKISQQIVTFYWYCYVFSSLFFMLIAFVASPWEPILCMNNLSCEQNLKLHKIWKF